MSVTSMRSSARLRRALLLGIAFALPIASWSPAALAQGEQDESRVKAAFLLRFTQYVEWPGEVLPQPTTPLVVGIIGADDVASDLQQMSSGRGASGRPVQVRTLKGNDDLTQAHILFIGMDERGKIATYLGAARRRPILVVTESPNALAQGSMINFVIVERRVRFEIGLESAEKAGLTLSSRLLAVAMRVHKGEAPPDNILASVHPSD